MPTTAERLAALETMTAEIHRAVVGNGSRGSSMRERLSSLETAHTHETSLKYRVVNNGAVAVVSTGLSFLAHMLATLSSSH